MIPSIMSQRRVQILMSALFSVQWLVFFFLIQACLIASSPCDLDGDNDCPAKWQHLSTDRYARGSIVKCMKYGKGLATFKDAKKSCVKENGVLISQDVATENSACLTAHHPNAKESKKKIWVDDGKDDTKHCPLLNVAMLNVNYPKKCTYRRIYVCYMEKRLESGLTSIESTMLESTPTQQPVTSSPTDDYPKTFSTHIQDSSAPIDESSSYYPDTPTSSSTSGYDDSTNRIIPAESTSGNSLSPKTVTSEPSWIFSFGNSSSTEESTSRTDFRTTYQKSDVTSRTYYPYTESSMSSDTQMTDLVESSTYSYSDSTIFEPHTSETSSNGESTNGYDPTTTTSDPFMFPFLFNASGTFYPPSSEPSSSTPTINIPTIPQEFPPHSTPVCINTDFNVHEIDEFECRIEPIYAKQNFDSYLCVWLNVLQEMRYDEAEQHCKNIFGPRSSLLGKEALDSVPTQCILQMFPSTIWVRSDWDSAQTGECLTFNTYYMSTENVGCSGEEVNYFACHIKTGPQETETVEQETLDLSAFCPKHIQATDVGTTFVSLSFARNPSIADQDDDDADDDWDNNDKQGVENEGFVYYDERRSSSSSSSDEYDDNSSSSSLSKEDIDLAYTVYYSKINEGGNENEDEDWMLYGIFSNEAFIPEGSYGDEEEKDGYYFNFENENVKRCEDNLTDSFGNKMIMNESGLIEGQKKNFSSIDHQGNFTMWNSSTNFNEESNNNKLINDSYVMATNFSSQWLDGPKHTQSKNETTMKMRKRAVFNSDILNPIPYSVTTNVNSESVVTLEIKGLHPDTNYRFRIEAMASLVAYEEEREMSYIHEVSVCQEDPTLVAKTKKIKPKASPTVEPRPYEAMVKIFHHILCAAAEIPC